MLLKLRKTSGVDTVCGGFVLLYPERGENCKNIYKFFKSISAFIIKLLKL
jgi:hypothetical protein